MFTLATTYSKRFTISLCIIVTLGFFITATQVTFAQRTTSPTSAELQAQITALMAQIAAMQSGGSGGSAGTNQSQPVFAIGAAVSPTTVNLRVRAQPQATGAVIGAVGTTDRGVVTEGPIRRDNISWYKVKFATFTGWVSGAWLSTKAGGGIDVQTFIKTSIGSNNTMYPGTEDASIAKISVTPATFDRYANRVTLEFTPARSNIEDLPWVAFEEITLWSKGWNVMSVNAGDMGKWRKVGSSYYLTVFTGNQKIAANRSYNLEVALTSDDDVPAGDAWTVRAPQNGVVIWSQTNGHMTNANPMTAYPINFVAENENDISIESLGTEAIAQTGNVDAEYGTYVFEFEITAVNTDIYLPGIPSGGVEYFGRPFSEDSFINFTIFDANGTALDGYKLKGYSSALTTSAEDIGKPSGLVNGKPVRTHVYKINEGETEDFTLTVTYRPAIAGAYSVGLESPLRYSPDPSFYDDTDKTITFDEREFKTKNLYLKGDTKPSPSNAITLTSPNGGEVWEIGVTNTVTWKPYGYSPSVNTASDVTAYLEVKNADGSFKTLGKVQDSGKASIHWPTGELNSRTAGGNYVPAGTGYYIRVVNNKTGATDRSDRPFTLLSKSVDLKINGSDGPVMVAGNQRVVLSWSASSVSRCEIHNAYTDTTRRTQIGTVPLVGTMNAYLHSDPAWGPTLYCYKRDGSTAYDSVRRTTSATATSPAALKVISPNGGEKLDPTKGISVQYEANGISSLSFALYKNDMWKAWIVKDLNIEKDQTLSADFIPNNILAGLGEGDNVGDIFKIYITGRKTDGSGYIEDKSDRSFQFVVTKPVTAKIDSFTVAQLSQWGGSPLTFKWKSIGTSNCAIWDNFKGKPSLVLGNLREGQLTYPVPKKYTNGTTIPYVLKCQEKNKANDQYVQATASVKLTNSAGQVAITRIATSSTPTGITQIVSGTVSGKYNELSFSISTPDNRNVYQSGSLTGVNGAWSHTVKDKLKNGTYSVNLYVDGILLAEQTFVVTNATVANNWTLLTTETKPFTVNGTKVVRYGKGDTWIQKTVATSGICSNAFFGRDPLPGTVKECQVQSVSTTTPPISRPIPTVRGASTDLLSEISKALEKISESLRTLK